MLDAWFFGTCVWNNFEAFPVLYPRLLLTLRRHLVMTWKPFKFIRTAPRRRPIHRSSLNLESLESRLTPAPVNVLTFHNDIASTGLNSNEAILAPTNVQVGSFGKLFVTSVDGQVYAEPLIDTGVTIATGVNTKPGAAGVHDVVFVATEHDSLYAIDAGQ